MKTLLPLLLIILNSIFSLQVNAQFKQIKQSVTTENKPAKKNTRDYYKVTTKRKRSHLVCSHSMYMEISHYNAEGEVTETYPLAQSVSVRKSCDRYLYTLESTTKYIVLYTVLFETLLETPTGTVIDYGENLYYQYLDKTTATLSDPVLIQDRIDLKMISETMTSANIKFRWTGKKLLIAAMLRTRNEYVLKVMDGNMNELFSNQYFLGENTKKVNITSLKENNSGNIYIAFQREILRPDAKLLDFPTYDFRINKIDNNGKQTQFVMGGETKIINSKLLGDSLKLSAKRYSIPFIFEEEQTLEFLSAYSNLSKLNYIHGLSSHKFDKKSGTLIDSTHIYFVDDFVKLGYKPYRYNNGSEAIRNIDLQRYTDRSDGGKLLFIYESPFKYDFERTKTRKTKSTTSDNGFKVETTTTITTTTEHTKSTHGSIALVSLDKNRNVEWTRLIPIRQGEEDSEMIYIGYIYFKTDRYDYFLFNDHIKNETILSWPKKAFTFYPKKSIVRLMAVDREGNVYDKTLMRNKAIVPKQCSVSYRENKIYLTVAIDKKGNTQQVVMEF
ncbi:MAG: hypothetical protein ABFS35_00300 [Bacteroidota bacterium]